MSQSSDCPGNFSDRTHLFIFSAPFREPLFHFGPNWSQYSSERAVSPSPRTSGSLGNFVYFPPDELYYIRRVDAKEDVQDFGQLRPCLDAFQAIVFLLRSGTSLPSPLPFILASSLRDDVVLFLSKDGRPRLTNDVCIPLSLQYSPVGAAGIACVSSGLLRLHTEELSVHLQAVRKPGSLVEGIE